MSNLLLAATLRTQHVAAASAGTCEEGIVVAGQASSRPRAPSTLRYVASVFGSQARLRTDLLFLLRWSNTSAQNHSFTSPDYGEASMGKWLRPAVT